MLLSEYLCIKTEFFHINKEKTQNLELCLVIGAWNWTLDLMNAGEVVPLGYASKPWNLIQIK
jgi:hypothetical protein